MDFVLPKGNVKISKMTSKEFTKNETKERKRSLLYLIEDYLRDCCLHEAADTLAAEAQLVNQYELCDNIDLDMILQDYNSYYYTRFDKYPKILKKINQNVTTLSSPSANIAPKKATRTGGKAGANVRNTSSPLQKQSEKEISPKSLCSNLQSSLQTSQLSSPSHCEPSTKKFLDQEKADDESLDREKDNRAMYTSKATFGRPSLCDFEGYSSEWREMADLITREIVTKKSRTSWADCVGLQRAVDLLKEAVVYPLDYPELFKGLLAPWKGVLLYGPPGTGKTLLARALAGESSGTFVNLTISTFVSKWRGESEKMLKVLFDVARLYAPTTIFIDELDALASKHEDNQHDASRRFKSELLVQLDGLLSNGIGDEHRVFVLGTTNSPWNLCCAILRRFEKRILVNVPDQDGRMDLFQYYFEKHPANNFARGDHKDMANMSVNFSGADIKLVCREVSMSALRERWSDLKTAGEIKYDKKNLKLRAPTMDDFRLALKNIHPSNIEQNIKKYKDWEKVYGCM